MTTSSLADVYTPLDSSKDEIRLLRILPSASHTAPLELQLDVFSLQSGESNFQALSYTWETPSESGVRGITLCGRPHSVTANLYAALRRLRQKTASRAMWIDAICINQDDLEERAAQVALMKQVYSKAREVLIWLGDSVSPAYRSEHHVSEDSSTAGQLSHEFLVEDAKPFSWLVEKADALANSSSEDDAQSAFAMLYLLSIDEHWCHKSIFHVGADLRYRLVPGYETSWRSLVKLFQMPWWTRVWVQQEFALAHSAQFVVGNVTAPASLANDFYKSYAKHLPPGSCCHESATRRMTSELWDDIAQKRLALWGSSVVRMMHLSRAQGNTKKNPGTALRELLWLLRTKESTDPRDKVYGVLGLLPDISLSEQTLLKPDYSLTASKTFARCTQYLIETEGDLMALVGPRTRRPDLPSWIPDLVPQDSRGALLSFQNISKRISCAELFNAASGKGLDCSFSGTELRTSGRRLMKVQAALPPFQNHIDYGGIRQCRDLVKTAAQNAPSSRSPERLNGALWRLTLRDTVVGETNRRVSDRDWICWNILSVLLGEKDPSKRSVMAAAHPDFASISKSFFVAMQFQSFFVTDDVHMGLGYEPQPGDEVWILAGGKVPFIMRPVTDGHGQEARYTLVGDCYVEGIMDGERAEEASWDTSAERIVIC
ncbi:heterokaryon incompatibility protein-domain-containing protein [Apiospora rasikravindrae]|uniref:Heterokaryon incompatibility protein-domain-containing protein n=1 Tax=Apiospora rasikravindrae TaxID=990691 RepID=A0ABR1SL18_9PEZI